MHTPTKHIITLLACAGTAAGGAHAQDFSNTLGDPGFGGSYVANFTVYDDGTGESLYTTGQFTNPGTIGGTNIAQWDGSAWLPVGGGLNGGYSNVITTFQGDLIAGGYFNDAGGVPGTEKLARWDGSAWHSMDAQAAIFLSSIWDLEVFDDGVTGEQLYIAGNYIDLGGDPALDHISKWDGANYSAVGGTIGGAVPLIVLDLQQADLGDGNKLYAGGRFLTIGGNNANNIAVWDGSAWSPLGGGLRVSSGTAQVIHMTAWDDGSGMALYAGGTFTLADGQPVSRNIAKWDGSSWSSMGAGFDSTVQELVVFDDGTGEALYAMGNFNNVGPTPVARIAKWNGSSWEQLGDGADGNVFGGIVYDAGEGEALIMGGGFSSAGGLQANRVVSYVAASDCPADITGDGELNFFDLSEFLGAFGDMEPDGDYNGDGNFNFFDLSEYLGDFTAGCP